MVLAGDGFHIRGVGRLRFAIPDAVAGTGFPLSGPPVTEGIAEARAR